MHEYAARERMTPLRAQRRAIALASPVSCSSDQKPTTEPLNSADTHVYALKTPGTNYLAKYAVPALCFKQHTPLNSEVEHHLGATMDS